MGGHVVTPDLPDPRVVLAAVGECAPDTVEAVVGASDTLVWRVGLRGSPFALRLLRAGEDSRCRKEMVAISAAAAAGLPVGTVRATGHWMDRPALLMDWCSGQPLGHALIARPDAARDLGARFGEAQALLHGVVAPGGLEAGWLGVGGPDAATIRERLLALPGNSAALIHLDYHPLNVLTDGERITGIIDWANAGAGDPRADLARTLSILELFYRRPGRASNVIGRFEHGWREGYRAASGIAVDDALALFFAWAGLAMIQDQAGKQGWDFLRRAHRWAARWARRGGCPLPG